MRKILACASALSLALSLSQSLAAGISVDSLLDDMTSLRRLAELPDPAYTTKQFSSYDRKSKTPGNDDWFANRDRGQFLRTEENTGRKEHVMMDAVGPGAIVRIWSANPAGTIRIYLDGADKPAIETPMDKLLGGAYPNLPKPIAGERSRGWNLYFPIPYAKHCKVTSDQPGFYYLVNYRTYPAGTPVTTFTPADLDRLSGRIQELAKRLDHPRTGGDLPEERNKLVFDIRLDPGTDQTVAQIPGPQAICMLWARIDAGDVPAAARSLILLIEFDGRKTVESPLGDFFGTAPGLNPYEALPAGVMAGPPVVLWSHWWMPFEKNAKVTIRNLGDKSVRVLGGPQMAPWKWTDRSLHFHAGWRIQRDIPTRPFLDWTHLDCTGNGRFVGGALHFINPVKNWWGEGDEKIYVDGESFPSHFGTGSEDYYGYAWGSPQPFTHAYHNQPRCDGPGVYGHTSLNRFHILDDIPFTKQFKFDMENWHSREGIQVTRAAVSYWYARPGGTDFFKPITPADVKLTEVKPYQVHRVPGVIEAEDLTPAAETTGKTGEQSVSDQFSGEKVLRWTAEKPGDNLTLRFDAPAGPHRVLVRFEKARDFARVQLSVNGRKAGDPIDLYAPRTVPTEEIDLGSFDLKEGRNDLTIEILGVNPEAGGKFMAGMDYVRLRP